MGSSILKYFWFILVLASGLVAALLGSVRYGVKIDFASWTRVSSEIINEIPVILKYPLIESYGFYGGMVIFLIFLVLFVTTSRGGDSSETEPGDSFDTSTVIPTQEPVPQSDDSEPDPDFLVDSLLETETLDLPAETLSFEADNQSNQDDGTSESIEYASEEEWIETVQKIKNREEQ
jgi:hypothetical protein